MIAVAAYFSWVAQKKRREALAGVAARLGWRFDARRDSYHDKLAKGDLDGALVIFDRYQKERADEDELQGNEGETW